MSKVINKYLLNQIILLILISFSSSSILTGKYPIIKRLNNGNYVVASSRNITFTDSSISTFSNTLNFESDIIDGNTLGSNIITQFPAEDNGYVIVILNVNLYIFTSTGEYLTQQNTAIRNANFPSFIITNGHSENNYFFTLIYGGNRESPCEEASKYFTFIKYTYNSSNKTLTCDKNIEIIPELENASSFHSTMSCDKMINNTYEYITCIYGIYNKYYISVFDPNDNYTIVNTVYGDIGAQFIKSAVIPSERNKIYFCIYLPGGSQVNCLNYNIESNQISTEIKNIENKCRNQPISLMIEYFYETNNFIVGCKEDGNTIHISEFDDEMNSIQTIGSYSFNGNNYGDIGRISVIFPQGGHYYTLYYNPNPNCHSEVCTIVECETKEIGTNINNPNPYPITEVLVIVCNLYYSYDRTECINEIPDGYYCNSTTDKTIDKCHEYCNTCDSGPTETNNSCTTCKSTGNIYLDLGNCVSECTDGHFTDNSIKKCKCSTDTSCEYCSTESKQQNLCVTCNTNYYPKKDDSENKDSFIKCYNDQTIGDGYYLNSNIYESCHSNCFNCYGIGTNSDNKCTTCNSGLTLIKNKENIENCYTTCDNYYYFDDNNEYKCTNNLNCPSNYKLIPRKRKCTDNCTTDDTYRYEYDNICYEECPSDTFNSNSNKYLCELNCKHFNKYFNSDQTACISSIPEGYYCNNNDINTIAQCHTNCKTCSEGPTSDNNKCETCKDEGTIFFDLGNCRESCINGNFIDDTVKKCKCTIYEKCYYCTEDSIALELCERCNNEKGYYKKKDDESNRSTFINCYNNDTKPLNYYLNTANSQYEPCHSNCMTCDEGGTDTKDNCKTCKEGYISIKNNDNITNCYQDCTNKFYYFDENNIYHCEESCPSNYKLINNTNKCIDNCLNDNIYNNKYELNNICYSECPSKSHISDEGLKLCEADLICNEGYINFEGTECFSDIPSGYYLYDDELKIIAQCHENCANCNKAPTENSNNCIECKNSKNLYLGNCLDECSNGIYEENSILKCICINNIECKECSKQSNDLGLCISCNTESRYYPKSNDEERSDGFIKCYKDPEGYFLKNQKYEACYENCLSCNELGEAKDNKCIECNSPLIKKNDFENDNNCYESCTHYYYYDSNKNHYCTDEDKCPENYKLISTKKRCIDNCTKIEDFQYEYENTCVSICPSNTHINEDNPYKCIQNLICEANQYYNFEKTECIDDIPIGFYCNNQTERTIAPCHTNCKTCSEGPTSDNNKCETCKDEGTIFFDLGNCRENCTNGDFINGTIKKCKCSTDIRCQLCDEGSKEINQCIGCNYDMGYYPKKDDNTNVSPYINCYKNPENYYLNDQIYEPCYFSCKYCTSLGNETNNKCLECISTHEKKNDFENDDNCYEKCPFNYYFDSDKIYHCTTENKCPDDYNKLIESKKRCIDDCKNDNKYQYEYQNKCYEKCPQQTQKSKNDTFLCELIEIKEEEDKEKCELVEKKLQLFSKQEISLENINSLSVEYANEYRFSNDYVLKYENINYKVYIYKNTTCVEIKAKEAPNPNFGKCYDKVKKFYNISDEEELIVTIVTRKENKKKNIESFNTYNLSHPITGELLNITKICANEKIEIQEDVLSKIEALENKKEEDIIYLTQQGIDVFNISDRFYNDLCFHFESPNERDVPMRDRISAFFPNITLCEPGCVSKGIDLKKLKAKCECTLNKLMNNDLMDNFYGQTIEEFLTVLNSFNINVVQCIKDLFKKEHFSKCFGGFIILGLLFGELICSIKFSFDGLYEIRKYMFSLVDSFDSFMKQNKINNEPAKKKKKRKNAVHFSCKVVNNSIQNSWNVILPNHLNNNSKRKSAISKSKLLFNDKNVLENNLNKKINYRLQTASTEDREYMIKIKEFLAPSFDEKDFEDVISKDKRKFCQFFCEKFQNNQIFINAFFIKEILRPRALKLLILIMTIELYFVINALFYNEEYLSELFNSKKKDTFFSFIPRRINQYIYTSAVSGIISYLISYFFVEEIKIKRIFSRNKYDEMKLKFELSVLSNNIKNRFIGLTVFSIFLSIIFFIYITCFNIVYPYIRKEWLKSSIFILILMQILNFIITLLEACFRYLSIKFNSKKIFRLSLFFS